MQKKSAQNTLVKIGEAAKLAGVSIDTLRRWEVTGKITPIRTLGGTRLYSTKQIHEITSKGNSVYPADQINITDAAGKLGVSTKTLRRWDEAGKLTAKRGQNGEMIYDLEKVQELVSKNISEPITYSSVSTVKLALSIPSWLKKAAVISAAFTIVTTATITAGYLNSPQKTFSFTNPSSSQGQVLGIQNDLGAFFQQVLSFLLTPFDQLSQKIVEIFSPERARELGFENSEKRLEKLINNKVNQVSQKIDQNTTKINNLTSDLSSTSEQINDSLNNFSIDGPINTTSANLISNSSFEFDTSGQPNKWFYLNQSNGFNTFVNNASVRSGNMALRIEPSGGNTSFGVYNPSALTSMNHTYTLSLYVRNESGQTPTLKISFWDRNKGERVLSKEFTLEKVKEWRRYSLTLDPPNQGLSGHEYYPVVEILNASSGNIFLDDIDLSEGSALSYYDIQTQLLGDGSVYVTSQGDIYPLTNNNGTLGLNNLRFESLYLKNGSIDENGNAIFTGNLTIDDNSTIGGNLRLGGDLNVDGGEITSSTQNFNLLNSNVTTLNIGNQATAVTIGASTGTTTINNNLVVSGTQSGGGAISLPDGSFSSPALNFTNDPDSGLYRLSANSIGLITGGSATAGVTIESTGNVGIGDTTADAKLEVLSTSEQLRLSYTDGSVDSRFTVDSSGNLNIDNTGTKVDLADDLEISGNDILDSGSTSRITLGATTTLTNTTTILSGTTTLTAESLATLTSSTALSLNPNTGTSYTLGTSATTANLFNSTTTTLNLGGAATTVSIGAATGTTTINNATTAVTGNLTVAGTTGSTLSGVGAGLTFSGTGNHDITASSGTLRLGAFTATGHITAGTNNTYDIGASGTTFRNIYANQVTATTISGTITGGNLTADTFTINSDNTSDDAENGYLTFHRGTVLSGDTSHAILGWDSTSNEFDFNSGLNITATIASTTGITVGAFTNGIDFSSTSITTDIVLQNDETIDNNTNGTINLTAPIVLTSSALTATGTLTANGDTDLGSDSSDTLTLNASVDSNLTFIKEVARTIQIADSTTANTAGAALTIKGAAGAATNAAGGALNLTAGAGAGTGNGGAVAITAGLAGATSGATGGAVTITSGGGNAQGPSGDITLQIGTPAAAWPSGALQLLGASGVGTNGIGTTITITAGNSNDAQTGGAVNITAGRTATGTAGAITLTGGSGGTTAGYTGTGGALTFTTGAGGEASGQSGAVTLATGTTSANSASATGAITIKSGLGSNSSNGTSLGGASGAVTLQSQAGGTAVSQTGGAAGTVSILGGAGGANSTSGTGGAGAGVVITAGNGGNGATTGGAGGALSFTAGNAGTGGNAAGGAITLTAGTGTGSGAPGTIALVSSVASGTTTTSAMTLTGNSLTTGTLGYLTSSSITTGKLLDITTGSANTWTGNSTTSGLVNLASSSTAGTASDSDILLNIARSGANANIAHTAYGLYSAVTNTNATSGTNIAGYFSASGATTANTAVSIGAISTAAGTNTGILLSTLTGGTTSNYQISTGILTSATTTTNAQINLGGVVTTGGTTNYGINVGALSGTGTTNYGINVGASTATGTTNYGMKIGAISGAASGTNYGLYVDTVSGAGSNYSAIFAGGNVGIGDTTPEALLDLDSTDTDGGDFLITNTGIGTTGTVAGITSNSTTTGDILTISSTALTSGTALTLTGPSSTGVTDHFVKVTADVGSASSLLNLNPDFSGSGVTGYGVYMGATDATANANTNYGNYISLAHTGNAAKTAVGYEANISSNSTTADFVTGYQVDTAITGAITSGTRNIYGFMSSPTTTAASSGTHGTLVSGFYTNASGTGATAGTTTVIGADIYTTATHAADAGTVNQYGIRIQNGASSTNGTSTKYGLYVESPTGADTNYAAYFAGGNVNIQGLSASAGVYTDASKNLTSTVPSSGTVGYWSRTSTTLSPATANDIVSIANTTTTGSDLAITNTGIYTGTGLVALTANSATSGDILTISSTALTSGSGIVYTGPSGGTAGVTDAALKISSDVGNIGTSNGLISSTATFDGTTASGVNLYLTSSDAIAAANTDYGIYNSVTNTGAIDSAIIKSSYGSYTSVSSTLGAPTTAGTTNVYGQYITTTATHAADFGTVNNYGLYVANGTSSTNGTSTKYGIYVEAPTLADNNYAAIFAGGNVGVGTVSPTANLDVRGANTTLNSRGNLFIAKTDTSQVADTGGQITLGTYLSGDSNAHSMAFIKGVSESSSININGGALIFGTAAQSLTMTEAMRINSSGNVGINDTSPDGLLDLDSSATATNVFGITNTGIFTGTGTTSVAQITANSATSGDILTISSTALTSGTALTLTGPTSTGVTDHFVKVTADVGSASSLLNLNPDFSGSGVTGYGIYNLATDATANANTDYGYYGSLALTGNAAKTGYGIYQTITDTSTTGTTLYGADILVDQNAAAGTGNKTLYGIRSQVTNDGVTDASTGTHNIYGGYFAATGNTGDTSNSYGVYAAATGGDNNYGVYVNSATGTGINIANTGITTDISLQNAETIDNNTNGTINLAVDATSALKIGSTGISSIGNVAHTIVDSSGALNIDSATTGAINIGTGANAKTITIGNNTTSSALAFTSGTGSQTFTSSVATTATTSSAWVFTDAALTTGTGMYLNSSSMTTGTLLGLSATAITSGKFLDISNGSSIFSISNTDVTTSLPVNFTGSGDVSIAYDLNFTNPTSSNIKSIAPLAIQAGETFNSSNLTLQTYNFGTVLVDSTVTTSSTAATKHAFEISTGDTTTTADTVYGLYSTNALSGAAAKTGVGLYSTVTTSSTTSDTIIAADLATSATGIIGATTRTNTGLRTQPVSTSANTAGIQNMYGIYSAPSSTLAAGSTENVYGGYFGGTATLASGTINRYGLRVATASMNTTGTSTQYGIYIDDQTGADTNYPLTIAAQSAATTQAITIGALSGTTANTGINIGAISGASATGTGITIGNISTTGTTNYGLLLGTMTGGTTSNYQISTGAVTKVASATNAQLNLGAVSGDAASSTNYGINIGAVSGTGTANYGILIGAVSGATANTSLAFAKENAHTIQIVDSTTADTAGGALTIKSGAGAATNAAGGALNLTAGAGAGTGNGGAITLTGGASGTGATGNGGGITLVATTATSTAGNGGAISATAGNGTTSGTGGNISLTAGSNSAGTGAAGSITLTAGTGNTTASTAGTVTIASGTGRAGGQINITAAGALGTPGGAGGAVVITAGQGEQTVGGAITITTGAGGSAATSGAMTLASGTTSTNNGTATGAITIQSGLGSNSSNGTTVGGTSGAVTLQSQAGGTAVSQTGGAAGTVSILGGAGGANSTSGTGGAGAGIVVTAGNGGNGATSSGAAGAITLTAGNTGTGGNVTGGALTLTAGNGVGVNAGGAITLTTGRGGSGGGNGSMTLATGTASGGSSSPGTITINTAAGYNNGAGNGGNSGAVTIQSLGGGTTATNTAGSSGAVIVKSSAGGAASGAAGIGGTSGTLTLSTGNGGAATNAASGNGGAAGALAITGGNGGASTFANGGAGAAVNITAGNAGTGGNAAGGAITLTAGTGTGSGAPGSITLASSVATGTTTTSAFVLTPSALTTGTGLYAASSTLTSGKLVDLQVSGTAAAASQTALNILTTGANGTAGITTYGAQISNTHSTNTSTNVGLYLNASGGATANYALVTDGGNVGIGTTTPTNKLDVKGSDGFAVTDHAIRWGNAAIGQLGYLGGSNSAYNSGAIYLLRDTSDNTRISANGDSFLMGGNVGINDNTPDALLDIDSSATTTNIFGITSTTLTTGEIADITATYAPTDGSTNEAIDLNITHTPTTLADNFQSLNLTTTDGTALANTVYNQQNTLTMTGNAAKTGYGVYSTVTSSSTTADTLYGGYFTTTASGNVARTTNYGLYTTANSSSTTADTLGGLNVVSSATGVLTTGTRTVYGVNSAPASTAASTGGTLNLYGSYLAPSSTLSNPGATDTTANNVYGQYVTTTATLAADCTTNCNTNQYGVYIANGTSSTNGTSKKYGLYVESPTGADTNYSAIFAGTGRIGIGTTAPLAQLAVGDGSLADSTSYVQINAAATSDAWFGVNKAGGYGLLIGYRNDVGGYTAGVIRQTTTDNLEFLVNNTTRAMAINSSGNVGIGDTTPTEATLVVGSAGAGNIYATFGTGGSYTNALCWDATGASEIQDCVGSVTADYMEMYSVQDGIELGDIVTPSDTYITTTQGDRVAKLDKSTSAYQPGIVGIISDKSQAGDFNSIGYNIKAEDNPQPVALNGRVMVKISNYYSQAIQPGDFITTSDEPGKAMKATHAGQMIGKALEEWTPGSGKDKVMVYVYNAYADPGNFLANLSMDDEGNLIIPKLKSEAITVSGKVKAESAEILGTQTSYYDIDGKVASLEQVIELQRKKLEENEVRLADLEQKVSNSPTPVATSSAAIAEIASSSAQIATSSAIASGDSLNLTPPELLLATGSATLADIKVTSSADIAGKLTAYDMTVSNDFKALGNSTLGNTVVAGDLTVDGTLSITGGNTINALSTLYLQTSPLADMVDIFNGLVTIDKDGNVKVQTIAAKEFKAEAGKSVGTGTISTGTKTVKVSTTLVKSNSRILVTPTTDILTPIAVTKKVDGTEFEVSIATIATEDISFDWFIVNESE